VLTLREGELDARLQDRERNITDLNLQLRELTLLLRKEQATREAQSRRIADLQQGLLTRQQPRPPSQRPRKLRNQRSPRLKRAATARPTTIKKRQNPSRKTIRSQKRLR
jgi:hypothetical protein